MPKPIKYVPVPCIYRVFGNPAVHISEESDHNIDEQLRLCGFRVSRRIKTDFGGANK